MGKLPIRVPNTQFRWTSFDGPKSAYKNFSNFKGNFQDIEPLIVGGQVTGYGTTGLNFEYTVTVSLCQRVKAVVHEKQVVELFSVILR